LTNLVAAYGLPAAFFIFDTSLVLQLCCGARANIMDTGKDLLAMKEKLGHGNFTPRLKAQLGMSPRTARYYISTAEKFGSVPQVLDLLPQRIIYDAAADSMPDNVRQIVIDAVVAGTKPDLDQLRRQIADGKEAERKKKRADRKKKAVERYAQACSLTGAL
jgi:hypothetical protein